MRIIYGTNLPFRIHDLTNRRTSIVGGTSSKGYPLCLTFPVGPIILSDYRYYHRDYVDIVADVVGTDVL
jgi:hypothetical protein